MVFRLLATRCCLPVTRLAHYTNCCMSPRTTVPIIHCTDYTHTAATNQTHFISLGLPLSDCRVLSAFITLLAIATLRSYSQCCQFSKFVARFSDFPTPFETFFQKFRDNIVLMVRWSLMKHWSFSSKWFTKNHFSRLHLLTIPPGGQRV